MLIIDDPGGPDTCTPEYRERVNDWYAQMPLNHLPPHQGTSMTRPHLHDALSQLIECGEARANHWRGDEDEVPEIDYGAADHIDACCAVARDYISSADAGAPLAEEHATYNLNGFADECHDRARRAGWWDWERNVGEMIALMHSELSEALEADRRDAMDDKLPHRKGIEVELADLLIRVGDFAAAMGLDLDGAVREKMEFNARRADHKRENRAAPGGKKY